MGVLDRFEKGIERAVNGAFAKAFRSEVQPVEIASALRRECDDRAAIVGRDRTIVPNTFVVELGPADAERLAEWQDALGGELSGTIQEHAVQQRYAFVGPVTVSFELAEDLDTGVFRVRSATTHAAAGHEAPDVLQGPFPLAGPGAPGAQLPPGAPPQVSGPAGYGAPLPPPPPPAPPAVPAGPHGYEPLPLPPPPAQPGGAAPTWAAVPPEQPQELNATLDVDGRIHRITAAVTVIGRATDADIVLDDPGVSRRHAEVHVLDGRARVIDLGSTNGTFVDGERVHAVALGQGSTITVGRTRIVFHAGQW